MEFEEVKKSLWHAFDILDKSSQPGRVRTTQVPKTKLRVLTNNLGHVLGVDEAETIWDKVTNDPVTFDDFISVLTNNLLIGLNKPSDPSVASLRAEIDNLCWMLCEKSYKQRISSTNHTDQMEKNMREFSNLDNFKLWKMFNFLSEWGADDTLLTPLRVDIEETERLVTKICRAIGLPAPKGQTQNDRKSLSDVSFLQDFSEFVCMIAERIGKDEPQDIISHGVTEIHNQIVSDIVKKGNLLKYGNKVTAWKERWFVLTATALHYYATSEEKDLKGSIIVCAQSFTQGFPDKPGGRQHRFKLHTSNKQYDLSSCDLRSKNEWMADLKRVVGNIGTTKVSLQRLAWMDRRKERADRRRRTAEEELRRMEDREMLKERERELGEERKQRQLAQDEIKESERRLEMEQRKREEEEEQRRQETEQLLRDKKVEIEMEKRRFAEIEQRLKEEREALVLSCQEALVAEREQRAQVEERLRQEEAALEDERRRLKELEHAKSSLEALVEEERALKRDEEIVRNLQSKILEEEYAKRAELEQLQEEQRQELLKEQLSRQELESVRRDQAEALELAERQLTELGRERVEANSRMKEAAAKLTQAETERQLLEQRLKLKEMTSVHGLARPLPIPDPNPFVTHRGLGAFTPADFSRPNNLNSQNAPSFHQGFEEQDKRDEDMNGTIIHSTKNLSIDNVVGQ